MPFSCLLMLFLLFSFNSHRRQQTHYLRQSRINHVEHCFRVERRLVKHYLWLGVWTLEIIMISMRFGKSTVEVKSIYKLLSEARISPEKCSGHHLECSTKSSFDLSKYLGRNFIAAVSMNVYYHAGIHFTIEIQKWHTGLLEGR